MVEERTGYRVSVGTTSTATADAEMIAAAADHPMHVINVSAAKTAYADYIVAVQCAMLLLMWADERGVPKLIPVEEKFAYLVDRASQWKGLAKLPRDLCSKGATMMVSGLLHQLRSQPTELHVIEYCARECPGLRQMQAASVEETLRRATESFRPEIRDMSPPDILAKNAAMNATLALHWSRISGSKTATIPYTSLGYLEEGERLYKLYTDAPGTASEKCVHVVDLWAEHLKLRNLYTWQFKPR